MTGGRVAATTGAAIVATGEIVVTGEAIGEVTGEAIGEVTGDAGALSATDMVLIAGIISGARRSAVRSSFPKC